MNNPRALESGAEYSIELAELEARLEEAEGTIKAIRSGEVDALVVKGPNGNQLFTLRGADEPYRIFVEQMGEGAITLDAAYTILFSNRAFAEIVDEPLEHIVGRSFAEFAPDLLRGPTGEPAPPSFVGVETMLRAGDHVIPVICSSRPIILDGPVAYAVTITDLTKQKENELNLRRATAELEGFCYSVSHDMRAPLRAMMANARIVIEDFGDVLPCEAVRELHGIAESAGRLGRLMDDLLTYSRLVRQEVNIEEVDLSRLAAYVASGVERGKDQDIVWRIEPGLRARGDSRLFEMALQNLFANAVKFSAGRRPAEIQFGYDPLKEAFFVEDNGIGFDMQYIDKLFVPFERLHRQAGYEGTGIGLANVKRVIARHGGRVWAEGEEGRRAAFYFTLS
jgi:signal transduction histidine kinase